MASGESVVLDYLIGGFDHSCAVFFFEIKGGDGGVPEGAASRRAVKHVERYQ